MSMIQAGCRHGARAVLAAAIAAALGLMMTRNGHAEPRAVVVELFTSQGCSSCPPADAYLGTLKDAPGVIALSLHVDYWDYIGWEDPYARARFTARQKRYVTGMPRQYVYTPQIVVDGRFDAVGSRRDEVRAAIAKARQTPMTVRPRFEADDDGARVVVPAGEAPREASVYLAVYDASHVTDVGAGENAGRTLTNHNVVRRFERLGTWNGSRTAFPVDTAAAIANGRDHCAVIVQAGRTGRVLGAAKLALSEVSG
jgi:hypothetical protein